MGKLIYEQIQTTFQRDRQYFEDVDWAIASESIRKNIYFRGPNVWILAAAVIIASIGLNINSIPMIVGAMLISPLMGPSWVSDSDWA